MIDLAFVTEKITTMSPCPLKIMGTSGRNRYSIRKGLLPSTTVVLCLGLLKCSTGFSAPEDSSPPTTSISLQLCVQLAGTVHCRCTTLAISWKSNRSSMFKWIASKKIFIPKKTLQYILQHHMIEKKPQTTMISVLFSPFLLAKSLCWVQQLCNVATYWTLGNSRTRAE